MSEVIHDVQVIELRRIADERGTIKHMLRCTDPHFQEFGEIYFSTVYAGAIKGWHKHRDMTLNYACVFGRIKLVIHDDRADSPSCGQTMEVFLGPDHYALVVIPPGLWNGFKGLSPESIVANCATHTHDPGRSERMDPYDNPLPYSWERRDH